jgi:hypothetical protein
MSASGGVPSADLRPAVGRPVTAEMSESDAAGGYLVRAAVESLSKLNPPAALYAFFAVEIGLQLLLVTPWGEKSRVLIRVGAFAASFSLLFILRGAQVAHPASKWALAALAIVFLEFFHPDTNGALAGCATVFLYLGTLGPIFWVPRLRIDLATVRRVFVLLWVFNTASALLGVLQVYFPGHFQVAVSSAMEESYLQGLSYDIGNGVKVLRPMGLTTQPGGASIGAMYSVVLGIALLLDRPQAWARTVIAGGMAVALVALCLSMVRSYVVMTGVAVVAVTAPLVAQGRIRRSMTVATAVAGLILAGFFMAVAIGGESVTNRLATLIEYDPATVYNNGRGFFLKQTFVDLAPLYPLGAGLGRWGVLCGYFGDRYAGISSLWAEIQWSAWLYDGGLPLIACSATMMLIALRSAYRIAKKDATTVDRDLQKWATAIFGYSVGTAACVFANVPFQGPQGVEFWVLNAMIFAASHQAAAREDAAVSAPGDTQLARDRATT